MTRTPCVLSVLLLVGCADAATENARKAEEWVRLTLFVAAASYYSCAHKAFVTAGECEQFWKDYQREREVFVAKYGDGTSSAGATATH